MKGFDWAGYIIHSLARAGFRDDDQQEHFHNIAVKLLVSPGNLFRAWKPGHHGPLERRFRRSVWNAIRNVSREDPEPSKVDDRRRPHGDGGAVCGASTI